MHNRQHEEHIAPQNFHDMGMFWYICHAEQPNCVYTNLEEYVARRNIKAGEELSVDYREWDKKKRTTSET